MQRRFKKAAYRFDLARGPIRLAGGRLQWIVALALVIANLLSVTGCSPKWGAPVESRIPPSYPSSAKRPAYYRVRGGDTLAAIAWRWGLDWKTLSAWNGIGYPYTIYPGQRLRLSPPKRVARKRAPAAVRKPDTVARAKSPRPNSRSRPRKSPPAALPPTSPSARERFPDTLRWRWPADGRVLTKYQAANEARKGIKIGGKKGLAVTAAEAGKVVYSGSGLIGYGRLIIIKHNNEYLSAYGHNRKLLVKEGDWVAKGDKIAEMGLANNGQAMLHFEIRRNGKPVNPVALLPRRSG